MVDKNQHPDGEAGIKKTDDTSRDKIINREIEDEMKSSFIDYAMSVIVSRALPDVRDGLKPVHRRVLFGMNELGVFHNKPYKKSARIVGDVMGKYHPHGDSAIYETMVRMAQDFSLRYPLVEGQGNFGSVDGDNAAAMRYTEARLNKIAEELLLDIDKDTVDFVPNFDNSLKEPSVLPCKIPNLLINGSSGIAVGMATNIPPHNLREISNAMIAMIDNENIELKDIIGMVKGPDFPTGGTIMGRNGIVSAFLTGKGKLIVRAKIGEEEKQGRRKLIATEIPYQVNKSTLIEQIADQVKEKKIEGISDIRDETSHAGMRIVIELKKEANSQVVINQLYKHTLMQSSFGVIMLSLVNNEPKVLNLKEMIDEFISHRIIVVKRRTTFELDKAEKRVHIVKGLLIALKDIRRIVDLILKSKNTENAREQLMGNFPLDKIQADAILEMRLSRLTSLEQDKTKEEHDNLVLLIEELKGILADHKKILAIIKQEITEIRDKYGDNRRTVISDEELEYFDTIDLIKEEDQIVTISHQGYIKRIPMDTYKNQNRGGKGIIAAETKEDDFIEDLFIANTHSYLLFFTDNGIVKWLSVYKLPEAGRYSMGKAIVNLVALDEKEKISACIPVKDFDPNQFLLFVTKKGLVKKTSLVEFSRPRQGGIRAINLLEGDELIGCKLTSGKDKVMIGTAKGQAVLFDEEDVRPMGRSSQGVRGIRLHKDDHVVEMDIADEKKTVLTITENGFGKRTEVSEYREINRGGKGVINIQTTDRNGDVVSVKVVDVEDEIMIITQKGILIRTPVHGISVIGRNTQGVRLMKLEASDKVVSSAKIMRNGIEKQNGEKELIMKYGEQLATEKQELNTPVSDNTIENTIEVDEEEKDDEEDNKDNDKDNSE